MKILSSFDSSEGRRLVMVNGRRISHGVEIALRFLARGGLVGSVRHADFLVKIGAAARYGSTPAQYRITQLGYDILAAIDLRIHPGLAGIEY